MPYWWRREGRDARGIPETLTLGDVAAVTVSLGAEEGLQIPRLRPAPSLRDGRKKRAASASDGTRRGDDDTIEGGVVS